MLQSTEKGKRNKHERGVSLEMDYKSRLLQITGHRRIWFVCLFELISINLRGV